MDAHALAKDSDGNTPLVACVQGRSPVVFILLFNFFFVHLFTFFISAHTHNLLRVTGNGYDDTESDALLQVSTPPLTICKNNREIANIKYGPRIPGNHTQLTPPPLPPNSCASAAPKRS